MHFNLMATSVRSCIQATELSFGELLELSSSTTRALMPVNRTAIHVEKTKIDLDSITHLICRVPITELDESPIPNA